MANTLSIIDSLESLLEMIDEELTELRAENRNEDDRKIIYLRGKIAGVMAAIRTVMEDK